LRFLRRKFQHKPLCRRHRGGISVGIKLDLRLIISLNSAYEIATVLASRKPKLNPVATVHVSHNAKTYLGRLVEKSQPVETVYMFRPGIGVIVLQVRSRDEPIPPPLRGRPGFFANAYSKAEDSWKTISCQMLRDSPPRAESSRINEAGGTFSDFFFFSRSARNYV